MNTIELLEQKIEELRQRVNSPVTGDIREQQEIMANLLIVDVALDALTLENNSLTDEEKFFGSDFEKVISLISGHDLEVQEITRTIKGVKNLIDMKSEGIYDGPYHPNQIKQLSDFALELKKLKDKLLEEQKKINNNEETELLMLELESLKNELLNPRKRKDISVDMAESLYNGYDIVNADPKEIEDLFEGLYAVQGGRIRKVVQRADFNDVLKLYREFLSPEKIGLVEDLLRVYRDEVTANIDLENSRAILEFFRDVNILESFERRILVNITLYGDSEYVKVIYERIVSNPSYDREIYFQDLLSSAWICQERRHKKPTSGIRSSNGVRVNEKSLISDCFNFTFDDFKKNADLLLDNIDILGLENPQILGAHLRAQTLSTEAYKQNEGFISVLNDNTGDFRKNVAVGRILGLGKKYKLPVSFFKSDIEDKLHLLIELGLLNPPMTDEFIKYEDSIPLTDRFINNHPNENIRNYYSRFMSKFTNLTDADCDYLFIKLHDLGPEEFYKGFFSVNKAGEGRGAYITERATVSREDIDGMVANKFVKDWYPAYINNFDRYNLDISDYNEYIKYASDAPTTYYDESILEDPLIKKLEEKHCILDKVVEDSVLREEKNNSVYMFGNTIISRHKVLKNASILKKKYGFLNEDMLLTSIVRKSYLTEEAFQSIYDETYERSATL